MNKNEWKKVKLENCANITMGQSPNSSSYNTNGEGIPFYQGNADFGDLYPKLRYFCTEPTKIANENDLLLSVRAPIGKINIATTSCCIGRGLCSITPKENIIFQKYLYYILKFKEKEFNSIGTGTTFKAINKNQICETEFLLPNIEEQKKITLILENSEKLLKLKKQQLSEFDKLVKFQFLKIFGDPILNEKNWKKIFLSDCCIINPKKNEIKLDDNFSLSFIGMADVSEKGKINTSNIKLYKKVKNGFTYFKENDVLFAKITPCMENGKGGIAKNLYNKIGFGSTEFHVLRPIENISNSYWLYYLTMLPFFRKNAEKNMTGSAGQKRVPVTYFQKTLIALPPIELQNKFADFVKQVDKSKVELQKSIDETQLLFDSLMDKYFG